MTQAQRRDRVHGELDHPNVRAFLRALRLGEGTGDVLGYRRLVGGGEFDSYADHPRKVTYIPRYGVWSSAAGAYQIVIRTWDGLVHQYGFGDFGPGNQDAAAVALMLEKRAVGHVSRGEIDQAFHKLHPVWASLPGSTAGQRIERRESILAVYTAAGGTISA